MSTIVVSAKDAISLQLQQPQYEDGMSVKTLLANLARSHTRAEVMKDLAIMKANGEVVVDEGWLLLPVKRGRVGGARRAQRQVGNWPKVRA